MVDRFTITAAEQDPWVDADHNGQWVRYTDYAALEAQLAALEAQLAVARKALEEISEPETVWRRRAAEDGIRLAAADIVALMRQRTPEIIARTALRKLDRQRVKAAKEASDD